MSVAGSDASSEPLLTFNARWIAIAHTLCSISAFLAAFVVAVYLHYYKIVKNEHYGYPDEWFPSVSATIGDWYPERSIFQILIALTAGPRFLLIFLNFIQLYQIDSKLPQWLLYSGIVRTVTCGGWVYITSNDDHDFHDIFMISYIVLTLPWNYCLIKLSKGESKIWRKRYSTGFFVTLIPLIYLFIQHKVHHLPGSYSYYAYTEWGLIILDIAFDSVSIIDFKNLYITLKPVKGKEGEYFMGNYNFSVIKEKLDEKEPEHEESFVEEETIDESFDDFNSTYFQLSVNLVNSFIFWSVLTSLFVCVWFFPLWYMGISGFEIIVGSILSPILLKISSLNNYCQSKPYMPRLFTVIFGVGAYLVKNPVGRLFSVGIGSSWALISLTNEISLLSSSNLSQRNIKSYAGTFMLGLILSCLAKYAYYSNNPIWPIMNYKTGGLNGLGLIIGSIFAKYTKVPHKKSKYSKKSSNWLDKFITSIGFGAFMYCILSMCTDSSTMITWVWSGYPIKGPVPVPHGAIVISIMCLGVYLGISLNANTQSLNLITISGIIGAIILYKFENWLGFLGGLMYIHWLCFISPYVLEKVCNYSNDDLISLISGSIVVFIIFILMHVWVVAYAFVPGGPLLRERTDLVLGLSTLLTSLIIFNFSLSSSSTTNVRKSLNKFSNIIVLFLLTSCIISFQRFQFTPPKPYHPESRLVTAGIWTIHFGLDNDMWASEHRMRDLIKDAELDVFGLLESDNQRIIMGNKDVTQRIANELNYYADFGPGPNKHTWGSALLSKFPIIQSTHHLLPSPVGELAPAIHATLDMYGVLVDVVVFHSGQEEDVKDRFLQSIYLQMLMGGQEERPMILLSYLVTSPLKGNYNTYVGEYSGMHDIDPTDDDRWCEYILYKKLKRTGYARISRGSITDTELQVGKFVIPEIGEEYDESYSQKRIKESTVPEDMRFPDKFYGEGVREHAFHVFDEPRYFD